MQYISAQRSNILGTILFHIIRTYVLYQYTNIPKFSVQLLLYVFQMAKASEINPLAH